MTTEERINEAIAEYERDFQIRWWGKYGIRKWQAVQTFQKNWAPNAKDFPAMLEAAVGETGFLFPKLGKMYLCNESIVLMAKKAPTQVRNMFKRLYTGTAPVDKKADNFRNAFSKLFDTVDYDEEKDSYQGPRSVSIFLWLHEPDRHMPFMQQPCEWLAGLYGVKFNRTTPDKLSLTQEFYAKFIPEVKKHKGLIAKVKGLLTEDCYPELTERILAVDIADYMSRKKLNKQAPTPQDETQPHFWWLSARPDIWSFRLLATGEEKEYSSRAEGSKHTRPRFNSVQVGDKIACFETGEVRAFVAFASVTKVTPGKSIHLRLDRFLDKPIPRDDVKANPLLRDHQYFKFANQSLFSLTEEQYDAIQELGGVSGGTNDGVDAPSPTTRYGMEDFLGEVFWDEARFKTVKTLLERKLNIILQGAPGVGKSFAARRLAYALMGCKDDSRIHLIQFHQSYSYEDFVQGYKPDEDGFRLEKGVFYRICKQAEAAPGEPHFLLIDEINRGNLSKIFGELLMLIEKGYRDKTEVLLAGNGEAFSVPGNLYVIGMMNTADRSLALMDYALRRRFSFCTLPPAFQSPGFRKACAEVWGDPVFQAVLAVVKNLNTELEEKLGKGYCIGHSFLCPDGRDKEDVRTWLQQLVEFDLLPLLEEYWFDDASQVRKWEDALRGALQAEP